MKQTPFDWSRLVLEGEGSEPKTPAWHRYLSVLRTAFSIPVKSGAELHRRVVGNWDRESTWPKGPISSPSAAVDLALSGVPEFRKISLAHRRAMGVFFLSHPEYLEDAWNQVCAEDLSMPGKDSEPPSWDEMERRLEERKKKKGGWATLWFGRMAVGLGAFFIAIRTSFAERPAQAALATVALAAAIGAGVTLTRPPGLSTEPSVLGFDLAAGASFHMVKKGKVHIEAGAQSEDRLEENTVSLSVVQKDPAGSSIEGRFRTVQTPQGSTVSECLQEVAAPFKMGRSGLMTVPWGQDQPSVRSIPTFPGHALAPGSNWVLPGELYYYDLKPPLRLQVQVQYRYLSNVTVEGKSLACIEVRYGNRKAFQDHGPYAGIFLTNEGTLVWDREGGFLKRYNERQDETFYLSAGGKQRFVMDFVTEGSRTGAVTRDERRDLQEGLSNKLKDNARVETYANAEGIHVRMKEVSFDFDSSRLSKDAQRDLETVRDLLLKTPGAEIRVSGHADSTGGAKYNDKLSLERARSVAEVLNKGGAFPNLFFQGLGGTKPVADNRTPEGRAANRRVEITIRMNSPAVPDGAK